MSGQADNAPAELDEVAQFLVDNPGSDGADDEQAGAQPDDRPEQSDNLDEGNPDGSPGEGDGDDPDEGADPDPDDAGQTSGRTFKVTIPGEDGASKTIEVDEKELVSSYLRHSDYTRKTQELAQRETQAVEVVKSEIGKVRNYYQQQAQLAMAAVQQLAGLKTPQEMLILAQTDPAAHAVEQARQGMVMQVLNGIQQGLQQDEQHHSQVSQQEIAQKFTQAWDVLGKAGLDKPKLAAIYDAAAREYGFEKERFNTVYDPKLVLMMRDAVAYREAQAKAKAAKDKATAAPRLPQRQNVAPATQAQQRRESRFRSGRASLNDLAAHIASL